MGRLGRSPCGSVIRYGPADRLRSVAQGAALSPTASRRPCAIMASVRNPCAGKGATSP